MLILDEPTSMLTPKGVEELEQILARLKGQGLAVVFITHKLHEAISMSDRVAILSRDGWSGRSSPTSSWSATHDELQERIVALMFGRHASQPAVAELAAEAEWGRSRRVLDTEPALELEGVTVEPGMGEIGAREVSLVVLEGEIMGIAGVDGNGQRELAEAIAGQRPLAAGDVRLFGHSIARFRRAAGEARPSLRHRRSDPRRNDRLTVGGAEHAEAHRQAPVLGTRPYPLRGDPEHGARADRALPDPHAHPETRATLGRNVQKVVPRASCPSTPRWSSTASRRTAWT